MNRRVGFIAVGAGLVGAYILPEAPRGYLRALFGGSGDGYPTAQIPGSGNVLRVDGDCGTGAGSTTERPIRSKSPTERKKFNTRTDPYEGYKKIFSKTEYDTRGDFNFEDEAKILKSKKGYSEDFVPTVIFMRSYVGSKQPGFEISDEPFDDVEFVGTVRVGDNLYEGFRYKVDPQVVIDAVSSAFKAEGRPVSKERQEEIDLMNELPALTFCLWYPLDDIGNKRPRFVTRSRDVPSLDLLSKNQSR